MPQRSRVVWSAGVGAACQIMAMALGFVTTPVLLRALGQQLYGTFAVIGSLTTYIGVLDLGIGASLVRFMSFHQERQELDKVGQIATFGLLFYAAFALFMLPLTLWAAPWIGGALSFSEVVKAKMPELLAMVVGLYIAASMGGVLTARLASIQRIDVVAVSNVVGAAVYSALVIALKPKRIELVLECMSIQIITSAVLMYIGIRLWTGPLARSPLALRWQNVRGLFSFGIWTQISSVTAVINLEADKAIISSFLGTANVAPYQVANRLAVVSRILPLQLTGAMLPHITAKVSRGLETQELSEYYSKGTRNLMFVTLAIGGFVAGCADALLQFWLGTRLPGAAALCVALVISYAVNNATGVGTTIIKAQGEPRYETYYGMISAAINVITTISLVSRLGLQGVVIGTIVGNIVGSVYFIFAFHRRNQISWWETIGAWSWKLVLMTAGAAVVANLSLARSVNTVSSRIELVKPLCIAGILYLAMFIAIGRLTSYWTVADLDRVRLVTSKLRGLRRRIDV